MRHPGADARSRPARPGSRVRSAGVMLSALALMSFAGGMPAAYASPAATVPVQQTDAIVKPSLAYIEIEAKGYILGNDLGQLLAEANGGKAPQVTANASCSGSVVNPGGIILTAGHCVDSQSVQYGTKGMIIEQALSLLEQDGYVTSSEASALYRDAVANGRVEGYEAGSPPDAKFTVYPAGQASGAPDTNAGLPASVVAVKSFRDGDVALLRIQPASPLPALQVAPSTPDSGTAVVAAGYPGAVTGTVDVVHLNPTLSPGEVSGTQSVGGTPVTQISADTSQGMSGGPVVDSQGRIVGTVSWGTTGPNQVTFNFMTSTEVVRALLSGNNVPNSLNAADQGYRAGLADYFSEHYHAAAAHFDQVLKLEPSQPGAKYYEAQATLNFPNDNSAGTPWLWIAIAAAAVLLLGGGTWFFLMRRRRGGGPAAPAPQAAPAAPEPGTADSARVPQPRAAAEAAAAPPAVSQMFCPNCGTPHDQGQRFCVTCGTHFEEAPPAPHPAAHG